MRLFLNLRIFSSSEVFSKLKNSKKSLNNPKTSLNFRPSQLSGFSQNLKKFPKFPLGRESYNKLNIWKSNFRKLPLPHYYGPESKQIHNKYMPAWGSVVPCMMGLRCFDLACGIVSRIWVITDTNIITTENTPNNQASRDEDGFSKTFQTWRGREEKKGLWDELKLIGYPGRDHRQGGENCFSKKMRKGAKTFFSRGGENCFSKKNEKEGDNFFYYKFLKIKFSVFKKKTVQKVNFVGSKSWSSSFKAVC